MADTKIAVKNFILDISGDPWEEYVLSDDGTTKKALAIFPHTIKFEPVGTTIYQDEDNKMQLRDKLGREWDDGEYRMVFLYKFAIDAYSYREAKGLSTDGYESIGYEEFNDFVKNIIYGNDELPDGVEQNNNYIEFYGTDYASSRGGIAFKSTDANYEQPDPLCFERPSDEELGYTIENTFPKGVYYYTDNSSFAEYTAIGPNTSSTLSGTYFAKAMPWACIRSIKLDSGEITGTYEDIAEAFSTAGVFDLEKNGNRLYIPKLFSPFTTATRSAGGMVAMLQTLWLGVKKVE